MTHSAKQVKFLIGALIIAYALLMPLTCAFADSQTSDSQGDFLENSWRFTNGVPTNPTDSEQGTTNSLAPQSTDGIQPRAALTLKAVGIDVSHHQGVIDWSRVAKTNVEYVIIQCGYGQDDVSQDDRQWLNNVKGCQANVIPFGVYLYSYAYDVEMATSEGWHVVHALQRAGLKPSDIRFPIYYDIEQYYNKDGEPDENYEKLTPDDYNAMWLAFKKVLNDAGYTNVGIYANADWWTHRLNKISIDQDHIWYARYGTNDPEEPLQPTDDPFKGFDSLRSKGLGLWQYSSVGKVDGIANNVDMNYCRSDLPYYYAPGTVTYMYRLYNPNSGEHLYTLDLSEYNNLSSIGWNPEGKAWLAPTSGDPVYRLYNPNSGDHHYTTDAGERNHLISIGWNDEAIGFYSKGSTPIYRLFNPNEVIGTHHYTMDESEYRHLTSIGWNDENIGWYAM